MVRAMDAGNMVWESKDDDATLPDAQEITFEFICHDMPGRTFEQWSDVRLGIQYGKKVTGRSQYIRRYWRGVIVSQDFRRVCTGTS